MDEDNGGGSQGRKGMVIFGPCLALFAILIVVTSAPGTTMSTIFVGTGKCCAQSSWAQVRGCALLPQQQVGCGCGSRLTGAPLILSHNVGHIIVTVATPNHALLFLNGRDINRGVFGVGNKDCGGGCGQGQCNKAGEGGLTKNNNQPLMGAVQ